MFLIHSLQQALPTNPLVIVVAIIAGVIAFFVFRIFFRALNLIFHLGCLALVAVAVFFILRNIIK
jgi:hypothetical protein